VQNIKALLSVAYRCRFHVGGLLLLSLSAYLLYDEWSSAKPLGDKKYSLIFLIILTVFLIVTNFFITLRWKNQGKQKCRHSANEDPS